MSYDPLTPDRPPFRERAANFARQFIATILLHRDAYEFIRQYQPWQGLQRYGWTAKVLIVLAIVFGWQFFHGFYQMITQVVNDPQAFGASMASAISDFSFDKYSWMLQGGKKYLVLIVLEIITFHFIQRTLEIQIGREPDHSFQAFIQAEQRMIAVSFISWILESVVQLLVNIPIGILGLGFLKQPAGLIIQFYFLGFALIDNYHECFNLKAEESRKRTWHVAGVAVAIGVVAYVLMFVPLVGVVFASMLGAVVAAMAMERFAPVTDMEMAAIEEARTAKKRKRNKPQE